jgi:hypothetical protein
MSYEARLAALGIDRAAITERFEAARVRTIGLTESPLVDRDASMKVAPPPLSEDLSHLNDPDLARRQRLGRIGGKRAAHRKGKRV